MSANNRHGHSNAGRANLSILGKGPNPLSQLKAKQKRTDGTNSRGSDYNLVAPIRQTASIFKQPVTVYKDHKSKVKSDLKAVNKEKPSQLFWSKRLGDLQPVQFTQMEQDVDTEINLPKKVRVVGPGITEKMLLASISTHLHLSKEAAYGQKDSIEQLEKNASAFTNPSQPLMVNMTVTEDDITNAEARVKSARLKLAQAIKGLV